MKLKFKEAGIPTSVFYPIPLHLQECFNYLKYQIGDMPISEQCSSILSLPMNAYLTENQINHIISITKKLVF